MCVSRLFGVIFVIRGKIHMEYRVAVISVIVEEGGDTNALNALLHEYGQYIVGRMGIPYRNRKINIISVVIDAPQDDIATLSGKIGSLPNISVKTTYSAVKDEKEG